MAAILQVMNNELTSTERYRGIYDKIRRACAGNSLKTLLGYINDGWNLTKAVNQALVDVGLNDFLTENIETAIREGAAIGAGVKTIPLLKLLESEWDGSGMKLSAKLHGTQKQMRQNIISTVQAQIALNKHAHETAMKLYDGYNTSDNVIRKQELPKYTNDLAVFCQTLRPSGTVKAVSADAAQSRPPC